VLNQRVYQPAPRKLCSGTTQGLQRTNLGYWCGSPGIFGLEGAPMLEFGSLVAARSPIKA
jgi:hypothetical protein